MVCIPVCLLLCEHLATHRLILVFKDILIFFFFFFTNMAR